MMKILMKCRIALGVPFGYLSEPALKKSFLKRITAGEPAWKVTADVTLKLRCPDTRDLSVSDLLYQHFVNSFGESMKLTEANEGFKDVLHPSGFGTIAAFQRL